MSPDPESVRLAYRREFEKRGLKEVRRQLKSGGIWGAEGDEAELWLQEKGKGRWRETRGNLRLWLMILALILGAIYFVFRS